MASMLIFSLDCNKYMLELIYNNSIQFGMGFQTHKLIVNGEMVLELATKNEKDVPLVVIDVGPWIYSTIF